MLILREFKKGAPIRVRQVVLSGDSATFGRSIACDYQLEQIPTVSRVQATIKRDVDGYWIIDGAVDKPSASGLFVDDRRMNRSVQLLPGTEVELFRGFEYQAILEVDDNIQRLVTGERSTMEMPDLPICDAELRGVIAALQLQVTELDDRTQAAAKVVESELRPEIENAQARNNHQDIVIKRVLTVLTVLLIAGSGYKLSRGDTDAVSRSFDVLALMAGITGGAMGVKSQYADQSRRSSLA